MANPNKSGLPLRKAGKAQAVKKRDKNSSKQKLLQAALEIFSDVGYDAATTKAISRRAGLNESLIQRYFKGKAGLLSAVIHMYAETHFFAEYPKGSNLEEEIFNYFKIRYNHDTDNSNFVRIAFHRAIGDPSVMKDHEEKYRHPEVLVARLKALQATGLIKPGVDLRLLSQMISAQSFMMGIMEYAILEDKNTEAHMKLMRAFARTIAQGAAKE